MTEVWKIAAGFPNYEVSSDGRVRRLTSVTSAKSGHILKATAGEGRGYLNHGLMRDGKLTNARLNRLVCATFHGNPPSAAHEAAHKDGNKLNNKAENLRWATKLENEADKDRHGTRRRGTRIAWAKLNEQLVRDIRRKLAAGEPIPVSELAKQIGVTPGAVRAVITGRSWPHVVA